MGAAHSHVIESKLWIEGLIRFRHTFIELCTGVSENMTPGVEFP